MPTDDRRKNKNSKQRSIIPMQNMRHSVDYASSCRFDPNGSQSRNDAAKIAFSFTMLDMLYAAVLMILPAPTVTAFSFHIATLNIYALHYLSGKNL